MFLRRDDDRLAFAGERMLFVLIMSTRAPLASIDSAREGHLIAVESALNAAQTSGWSWIACLGQHRLERLDAEAVERRGAVEQHGAP